MQYDIDFSKKIGKGTMKSAYLTKNLGVETNPDNLVDTGLIIDNPENKEIVAIFVDMKQYVDKDNKTVIGVYTPSNKKLLQKMKNNFDTMQTELIIHDAMFKRELAPEIFGIVLIGHEENGDHNVYRMSLEDFTSFDLPTHITEMFIYEERCGKNITSLLNDNEIDIESFVNIVFEFCDLLVDHNILFMDIKPGNTCVINNSLIPIDFDDTFIDMIEMNEEVKSVIKIYMITQFLCVAIKSSPIRPDIKRALKQYLRENKSTLLSPNQINNMLLRVFDMFCKTNDAKYIYANPIKMLYFYTVSNEHFSSKCSSINLRNLFETIIGTLFEYKLKEPVPQTPYNTPLRVSI